MSQAFDIEKIPSFLEFQPFLPTVFLEESNQKKDTPYFQLTILVIGPKSVGKSSIITAIVRPPHAVLIPLETNSQSGIPIFKRVFYYNNLPISIELWDLPGSFEDQDLVCRLCKNKASGVLLVYDVTEANSLKSLHVWAENLSLLHQEEGNLSVPGVVIGNKIDLANFGTTLINDNEVNFSKVRPSYQKPYEKMAVPIDESIAWADRIHAEHFFTSAVNAQNLMSPLEHLVTKIMQRFEAIDNVTEESFFTYRMHPIRRLVPRLEIRYKNLLEEKNQISNGTDNTKRRKTKLNFRS